MIESNHPLLTVYRLDAGYGRIQIVRDACLRVETGECVVCMGPNGAGKSTLLKAIVGLISPYQGVVQYRGQEIQNYRTSKIASLGVSLVPQGRGLFRDLTVLDNVLLGGFHRNLSRAEAESFVHEYFPDIVDKLGQRAGTLSGGQQQMTALARGLISSPGLLLLDEPSVGLAPVIVDRLARRLQELKAALGVGILLVEQNVALGQALANRSYVMTGGHLSERPPKELLDRDQLAQSYLGGQEPARHTDPSSG